MASFYVTEPMNGIPSEFENGIQENIYLLLEKLGIDFTRVENEPAVSMEDCKNIDKAFGEETIKTIFLTNRQKTKFYLLSMPASKPFITKDFGSALEIPRVSFADGELLLEMLGTPHGAATPLSIIRDEENKILMVIDEDIMKKEKLVVTDSTLHGYICLKGKDLVEKFLPVSGHQPILVKL